MRNLIFVLRALCLRPSFSFGHDFFEYEEGDNVDLTGQFVDDSSGRAVLRRVLTMASSRQLLKPLGEQEDAITEDIDEILMTYSDGLLRARSVDKLTEEMATRIIARIEHHMGYRDLYPNTGRTRAQYIEVIGKMIKPKDATCGSLLTSHRLSQGKWNH